MQLTPSPGATHRRVSHLREKLFRHLLTRRFNFTFDVHQAGRLIQQTTITIRISSNLHPAARHVEVVAISRWNQNAWDRTHHAWLLVCSRNRKQVLLNPQHIATPPELQCLLLAGVTSLATCYFFVLLLGVLNKGCTFHLCRTHSYAPNDFVSLGSSSPQQSSTKTVAGKTKWIMLQASQVLKLSKP